MAIARRQISALRALYQLEPTARDVFVEGMDDKRLLLNVLRSQGCTTCVVFDIDAIEIDFALLQRYGLTEGKRQRVLALAQELGTAAGDSATCIIDRDFDDFGKENFIAPHLLRTDPVCMEGYAFRTRTLHRLLQVHLRYGDGLAARVATSLVAAANGMFACRVMHHTTRPSVEFPSTHRYIELSKELSFAFDRTGWLQPWRAASKDTRSNEELLDELGRLEGLFDGPKSSWGHKDDLVHLFRMLLLKQYGAGSATPESAHATLLLAIHDSAVSTERLFETLASRVA
ncbi:MAG: DUF4435 domain-containing protein [Pseudomonadota bacterium]